MKKVLDKSEPSGPKNVTQLSKSVGISRAKIFHSHLLMLTQLLSKRLIIKKIDHRY